MLLVNQCWLYHKTLAVTGRAREGNFLKIIFLEKKNNTTLLGFETNDEKFLRSKKKVESHSSAIDT